MRTRITVLVCGLGLLLLGCERDKVAPPIRRVEAVQVEPVPVPQGAPNTTVPTADSVFSPAAVAAKPDATAVRTNKALTRSEESNAMPLPGQANDHSAPSAAARRASGQ